MPQYKVRGPDGRVHTVNAPKGASQQDAIAYVASTLYAPAPPAAETTTGEKAQALASSFIQGTGGLIKDIGMLVTPSNDLGVPTVSQGVGNVLTWLGDKVEQGGKYIEPEALAYEKARQAARVTEEAGRPGAISRGVAAVGSTLENVPLIGGVIPTTPEEAARAGAEITTPFETGIGGVSFVGQQLPATLASITPAGAGRALAVGATERAAAVLGRKAGEKALQRAATVGATAPSAAINAASAGRSAYENVITAGGTEDQANEAYREAFAGATVATGVAGMLPGIEQRVAGAAPTRGVVQGAIRTAAGEIPQEFIEEAGSQYAQNLAQQGTAAEVPLGQGVLSSGALGAIGGGMFAGPVGAIQGYRGGPEAATPMRGGEDIQPGVYAVNVPAPGGTTRRVEYTVTGVDPTTGAVMATAAGGATGFTPADWKRMIAQYGEPTTAAVAPTQPVEPVEPVEPVVAAPTEPVEPVAAAPTEPVEPAEPVVAAPTEPTEPVDITPPTEPVEPVGPAAMPISVPAEPLAVAPAGPIEATQPLFPIEEPLVAPPKLPMDLAVKNPQHKGVELDFKNDIDRALYMATSTSPNKQPYIDWLANEGYSDPAEVQTLGKDIRKTVSSLAAKPSAGPVPVEQFATPRVLREAGPLTQEQADEIEGYDAAFVKGVAGKSAQEATKFAADRTQHPYYRNILGRISSMMSSLQDAGATFTFDVTGQKAPVQSQMMVNYLKGSNARGAVSSSPDAVHIGIRGTKSWKQGGNQKTFVHEMVHAVTVQTMVAVEDGRIDPNSDAGKAVVELNDLFKQVLKYAQDLQTGAADNPEASGRLASLQNTNFFANSRELIAWGLSQYDAQQFLKAMPVKKGNAFTEFVRIIGRMLGLNANETNALQNLISITERMLPADQKAREEIAKGVVGTPLMTPEQSAPIMASEEVAPEAEVAPQPEPATDPDTGATFINVPNEETRWDKFQRIFVNDMRRLGFTEELIEKAIGRPIPWSAKPTEAAALYEGRANQRLDDIERDHFKRIIKIIKDRKLDPKDVDMFLYARAAADRNAKIADRNPNMPDGGSGMSNADAQAWMDMFVDQGQYVALEEVGQAVDAMVDATLATRVAYGLLSQEQATALREAEPHYVPMKGLASSGDITVEGEPNPHAAWAGTGLSITPREYRKAKGRTSMPFSPLANAMVDARAAVLRGEKNRVGQKFLNEIVRKYQSNAWQAFTDENPERDAEGNAKPMAMLADRYFVVKENGKPHYIRINDPMLMRAMTKSGSKQVDGFTRSVINAIRTATVMQSKVFTTLNPEFAITNYLRDIQAAVFNILGEQDRVGGRLAGESILKGVMKDVKSISNIRSVWKSMMNHEATTAEQRTNNALFLQAKEDGAFTGWIMTESPSEQMDKIKQEIKEATAEGKEKLWYTSRDRVKKVIQSVEDFNSIFENVTRFSVYKRALEAGLSRDEAANMARNVTVDFNKKGEVSSVANALFAFFNATVRGHAQMLRSLTGKTAEGKMTRAQKLVGSMAALGALQVLMGTMMSGEDDDGKLFYDKIPENEKSRNLILMNPLDGETYLKIPLPYGYSFFHKFGTDTTELVLRDKSPADYALGFVGGLRENFSPLPVSTNSMASFLTSLTPTVSKPFFDIAINENYFGSPIYNEPYDEEQALSSVSRYSTPEGYKAVAEFLNEATGGHGKIAGWADMPAEGIKHLVESYTGGTGRFIGAGLGLPGKIVDDEVEAKDVPIARKILGSPNTQADIGEYYNRTAEMGPIVRQLKDSSGQERRFMRDKYPVETNPAVIAARTAAEKELKEINKQKKALMDRDSSDYTEAALDRLKERQHNVYIKFNRTYNRVEERER